MSIVTCSLFPFAAAIFDLDGTLLDSMWVWHAVDRAFFAARGLDVPEGYVEAIQSLTFRETARYTIDRLGLPESPEQLMAEWESLSFLEYRDHVRLKPGAGEVLRALRARDVRLGTATNLSSRVARTVLEQNGVLGLFDALTTTEEVTRGKGYPDIYLLAARKLGVPPGQCVAFDDVAKALLGIRAAGMAACAVWEPGMPQDWDEMVRLSDFSIMGFEDML